ncbi:helix-turn-helix domain-containing protein [Bradyrhizobium sp. P5_C12]
MNREKPIKANYLRHDTLSVRDFYDLALVVRIHRTWIEFVSSNVVSAKSELQLLAERLKRTREAKNLNQADWCRFVGIEPQAWSNYENAVRRISIDQAIKVCVATGASLDWIYRGHLSGLPVELVTALQVKIDKKSR